MAMLIPIRDENPHKGFPLFTIVLIAVNVVVFLGAGAGSLFQISERAAFRYGAIPCDVMGTCDALSARLDQTFPGRSPILSVFTAMFMHADIFHLGFNMLFLWVFGNNVEDFLGRIRFVIFYFLAGIAAALAFIALNVNGQVPTIGASGAVSGVLGAYFVLWPRATVVSILPLGFFFFPVRMQAWIVLGLWFIVQILGGLAGLGQVQSGGGVAYLAHVGGFIAGLILIVPFGKTRRTRVAGVDDDFR
jgi:membrane associated rhomboid family serine protease